MVPQTMIFRFQSHLIIINFIRLIINLRKIGLISNLAIKQINTWSFLTKYHVVLIHYTTARDIGSDKLRLFSHYPH